MKHWRQFRQLYALAPMVLTTLLCCDAILHWAYAAILAADADALRRYTMLRAFMYCIVAAILSAFRVENIYPGSHWRYARWLRTTPWTVDKPLPLGSVFPTGYDLALAVVLSCLATLSGPAVHPATVSIAMIGGYAFVVTLHLLAAIWWKSVLGVVPFLAAGLLLHAHPWLIFGVALLLLLYLTARLRALLARFHEIALKPGEAEFNRPLIFWGSHAEPELKIDEALGPTHALLHNDKLKPIVPIHIVLLATAGAGFSGWVLGEITLEDNPSASSVPQAGFLIVVIALIRWLAYVAWPPISVWGRLRIGRLILPRFDRALLVPIAIVAAGFLTMQVLTALAMPLPWNAAATLSLTMLIAVGAGPTRGAHRLTAAQHYRVFNIVTGNILSSAPSCEPTLRGKWRFRAN